MKQLPLRIAAIAIVFAAAAPALAASDYLLEIDGYAGPGKPGTIGIKSRSWGMSNPAAASAVVKSKSNITNN